MTDTNERTVILEQKQVSQKITRIAHEIYENNFQQKSIVIVGVHGDGYVLAERITKCLKDISAFENISLFKVTLDKDKPLKSGMETEFEASDIKNKIVILVDDVLNSGRTLVYATKFLLDHPVKGIQTACLVDRKHRKFPIRADYVGLTLSTTLQEHIEVELGKKDLVYLD